MDIFLCICVLFCIGSMCGWVIELLFRRFFSSHKWINPGFLVGPYLPLYGFGLAGLFVIQYLLRFDEWFPDMPSWVCAIITVLVMGIVMTVIEYIAGLIFIKGMKIKLWDYSDRWGNIQGIICPLFSLFWLVICAGFYFLLYPVFENLLEWFSKGSIWLVFLLGMFYGIILIDFVYSVNLTSKITAFAKEKGIVVKYESFKEQIRAFEEKAKTKINYALPFRSSISLKEQLEIYHQNMKKKSANFKETVKENVEKLKEKISDERKK